MTNVLYLFFKKIYGKIIVCALYKVTKCCFIVVDLIVFCLISLSMDFSNGFFTSDHVDNDINYTQLMSSRENSKKEPN